jgi:hypothetical protein
MSVSTEVQRTLVKSPPELWSELSNPEALARHLSELGDVRITAIEPETKVEWEAEDSSGIVHLKQSGWGTKVTLTVTRAAPAGTEALSESEAIAEPEPAVETEPVAAAGPEPESELATQPTAAEPVGEVEPEQETAAEPTDEPLGEIALESDPVVEPEPKPVVEPEPVAAVAEQEGVTEPGTRPGFFARLFRRGHTRRRALADALAEFNAVTEPEIEVVALAAPEPTYPARAIEPEPQGTEQVVDLAAELASVEAQMTQETTELLTGVLDRLGAAHHRPFSRG